MTRNNEKPFRLIAAVFNVLKKIRLMLLFFLLLTVIWYGYQIFVVRPALSFKGIPQTQAALNFNTWNRTLTNQAFLVGYSDKRGNPLWVSYKLQPVSENAPRLKRPTRFSADWRAWNKVKHQDYDKTGYDRGHLAPNYAISSLYGKDAQLETFLLTNISPQKPNLNRKIWQRLEEVEVKYFTRLAATIWVTTGPVFDEQIETFKNARNVEIPDAFYKVYAMQTGDQIALLAFLIPQNVKGNEALDRYVVTVDKIEALTGLDFFHELNAQEENVLESTLNIAPWKLGEVSRLPSRY